MLLLLMLSFFAPLHLLSSICRFATSEHAQQNVPTIVAVKVRDIPLSFSLKKVAMARKNWFKTYLNYSSIKAIYYKCFRNFMLYEVCKAFHRANFKDKVMTVSVYGHNFAVKLQRPELENCCCL